MIQYIDLIEDTICAPITASGYSGVAVIRVSGEKALEFTKKSCSFLKENIESHKIYLGSFCSNNGPIDQVLISYFKKGSSFTSDETIEISCHGNPLVINKIVNEYLKQGCRNAEKGEFSFRAFYNGKIDLVQAESIQNLILSNNSTASTESLKQLDGNLSKTFANLEDNLILAISHLEASIDFVEQDLDNKEYPGVLKIIEETISKTKKLVASYDVGKNLLKGYQVLLVGEPNGGKSSLFNQLFNQEKAIVTDVSGTTRDLISGETFLASLSVEFTDSAGLRESSDKIEAIGIKKTLEKIKVSDALLVVIDSKKEFNKNFLLSLPENKCFFIFNKIDLIENRSKYLSDVEEKFKKSGVLFNESKCFFISALNGEGIEELKKGLLLFFEKEKNKGEQTIISQVRHFNHLSSLQGYLLKSSCLLREEESPDLISQELQYGLMEIQKLLGKTYDDQILDKIFSEFCVGK